MVGEIAAGAAAPHRLSPGTAMKVMTGAPVPEHADAMVPYENTDRGVNDVKIYRAQRPGPAHPSRSGRTSRRASSCIAPATCSARGTSACSPASAWPRCWSGRGPGSWSSRPAPSWSSRARHLTNEQQIFDSNSYLLAAAAKAAGAQVFHVGQVGDDAKLLKEAISDALIRADLILTSGGISQGDYDIVKAVMPELGECDFVQVAMQPGKPQGFGLIGDDRIPMIMVPGQSGQLVRVLRGVRPPGDPQADGRPSPTPGSR